MVHLTVDPRSIAHARARMKLTNMSAHSLSFLDFAEALLSGLKPAELVETGAGVSS